MGSLITPPSTHHQTPQQLLPALLCAQPTDAVLGNGHFMHSAYVHSTPITWSPCQSARATTNLQLRQTACHCYEYYEYVYDTSACHTSQEVALRARAGSQQVGGCGLRAPTRSDPMSDFLTADESWSGLPATTRRFAPTQACPASRPHQLTTPLFPPPPGSCKLQVLWYCS